MADEGHIVKTLLVRNDPPYGTERSYNGMRLAGALARRDDCEVRVFLMGDGVGCAAANQKVPDGYYHLDRMIDSAARPRRDDRLLRHLPRRPRHRRRPPHQGRATLHPRRAHRMDLLGRQGRHLLNPPTPATTEATPAATWRGVAYDRWFDQRWGRYAFGVESRAVLRAAPPRAGARVLDAGCGTGRFAVAVALARAGATVIGTDPDPSMLAVAAARLPGRCTRGVIEHLPFPTGAFDLAMAVTVLEFVADPAAAMAELARVTRPGGRILVGALNPHSPWGLANRRRLRSGVWCDARFLTRSQLLALAAPYGPATLHPALYAPGWFPGLAHLGGLLEAAGRSAPRWGAFQVLAVDIDKSGDQ